eukprot:gene4046-biopygen5765
MSRSRPVPSAASNGIKSASSLMQPMLTGTSVPPGAAGAQLQLTFAIPAAPATTNRQQQPHQQVVVASGSVGWPGGIQAAVRGWLCRKSVLVELLSIPQTRGLRRHWAAARLRHAAHALEGLVQQSTDDLDTLEAELEATLAASRQQAVPCRTHNLTEHAIASPSDDRLLQTAAPLQRQSSEGRWQLRASAAEALTGASGDPLSCRATSNRQRNIKRSGSSSSGAFVHGSGQRRGPLGAAGVARQLVGSSPAVRPSADTFLSDHRPTQQPQLQLRSHNRHLQQQQQQPLPAPGGADRSTTAVVAPATAAVSWEAVVGQACERGETDCAICLGPLAATRETKGVALLSCSHTFHMQCVLSFEAFETARSGQPSCPICRAAYTRRCFALPEAC